MGQLDGKVAIITGASRGLGFATSQTFYNEGASVVMASRNVHNLAKSAVKIDPDCQFRTDRLLAVQCNVQAGFAVQHMVERVIQQYGRIDILVCNAGVYGPIGLTDEVSWHEWADAINTNVIGTFHCCAAVIPYMRTQKYGKIVTLSGGGATTALPRYSAYSASKTAVVRLTETLSEELTSSCVYINAVAPGALNTDMFDEALEAGEENNGPYNWARLQAQQKSGGNSIQNAANLILHLSTPETDGVTGCLFSAVWDNWHDIKGSNWVIGGSKYKLRRMTE